MQEGGVMQIWGAYASSNQLRAIYLAKRLQCEWEVHRDIFQKYRGDGLTSLS